ncbi:hypothetical protein [Horticoccus sp. 23ND18S-11]|uniref:hypothetical protein n=1 Tax=Horticoccus sp. 23ND18S-11 TaxID=3391832 RepID=UPI0039C9DA0C
MTLRPFLLFLIAAGVGRAATAEPVAAPAIVPARTPAAAATKTAPARTDSSVAPTASFDTFRLVSDRNIFNPNRTGRRDRTAEEKPPRTDMIALVGTMESERGLRAFFDGSETGYRKALRVGESVDKFKVTQITPTVVDLERDGKNLSVKVGQQLRRPEGADWDLVGEDVVRREAEARALAESKADPAATVVVAPPASEIEKRMRERRKKDFKDKDFKN